MQKKLFVSIPFLSIVFLTTPLAFGESIVVNQTKTKLQEIENKITSLQKNLYTAQDKRVVLNKELSITDKNIGDDIASLRIIKQTLVSKKTKIEELQKQVDTLTEQLKSQEQLLAKHVQSRYKMGEYEPLKWILNQDNPQMISRLLSFYQYIIQARQKTIHEVHETRKNLTASKEQLHAEILTQQTLEEELTTHQHKLEQDKLYQSAVIHTLNKDIQNTKQALNEFQRNKANLSRLLKSLAQQSIIKSQQPFTHMRHRLIKPTLGKNHYEKMNQGVKFFANEGDEVVAVYGGRVVFSDWLKGYGLLLIIDHGWGFMSLYANNQSLFKQKGDTVAQGEQIATVGHTGGFKQNGLYFEIRQRGKAIPPLEWLS